MKRAILVFLVLSMLVTVLAACKGNTNNPGGTVKTDPASDPKDTPTEEELDEYGRPIVKSSLPEGLDYQNEQVNIMLRSCQQTRFLGSDETTASSIEQVLYERNNTVMDKLNVYMKYVTVEQSGSDVTFYNQTVNEYLADAGVMDIVTGYAYYTPALAISGCFANLNDIKLLDMSSIVWNQTFADAVEFDGALYFNVGDFSFDYIRQLAAVYFNKELATTHLGSVDQLYEMVRDGSWTIENVAAMLKDVHQDKNGDDIQDANDFYGFTLGATSSPCEAMVTGLGFNYTYKDSNDRYQLFEMDTALSDKIDAIQTFISSEFCAPRSLWTWSGARDMFIKQNVLFYSANLDMADAFKDVDFHYGFLPMFKYDESSDYYTGVGDSFSLQCVMANCTNKERAGAILQCLNEVSYRIVTPEYFDVLLMGRFADSPDDAEMLELIRSTVVLDFGRIYSCELNRVTGGVWNNFVSPSGAYSTWYGNNATAIREKLVQLQDKLETPVK